MNISFYNNSEPKNKINKTPVLIDTFTGVLRDQCNVSSPVILIENDTLPAGNYLYIDEFSRFYFLKDIENIRTGLWEVSAEVDVLKSYAEYIMTQKVILNDTTETGKDLYVANDVFMTTVKTKTDIMSFPSGLLDSGEFILVTAGGIAV